MEELNLENILGAEDIDNLFVEEDIQETPPEEKETEEDTTEVDKETLFDDKPESVGSEEENIKEEEDTNSSKGDGVSPKHFYSSIAKALKDEGIFPDLDDDAASKIATAEDFRDLINLQIKAGIDERNQRIDNALDAGVEVSKVREYENILSYLDSIKEDSISDESDKGEALRKQLIMQDFLNRGYSKERAEREVKKSFSAGSDIEDAKEALASNKAFFEESYDSLIKEANEKENTYKKKREEEAKALKKSILEDKNLFGELQLDKSTRQRIFDNISKPVYKNPETGEFLTALQKYESENHADFMKNVGILFTLTNGFTDLTPLIKGKVQKEVKKGLKELEHTLNNTARTTDGNIRFISGVEDSHSSARGWDFDV